VTGLSWLDVDTPEALREAERQLMLEQGREDPGRAGGAPSQLAMNVEVVRRIVVCARVEAK